MTCTIDFSKYSSIHIGPQVEVEVLDSISTKNEQYYILGRGNNILVGSVAPCTFAVLGKKFDYIVVDGDRLKVGAATSSAKLLSFCKKNNIAHFELLSKLPGTIGAIVKMNAGLKQWEIGDNVLEVLTAQGYRKKEQIKFAYRHSNIKEIIYEITFKLQKGFDFQLLQDFVALRKNQPHLPSAGSCFKNPPNTHAGKLLEEVGLKGYRIGSMSFSHQHANFLVNEGKGTFSQAMSLIALAKAKVWERFQIELEEEIIIIDFSHNL